MHQENVINVEKGDKVQLLRRIANMETGTLGTVEAVFNQCYDDGQQHVSVLINGKHFMLTAPSYARENTVYDFCYAEPKDLRQEETNKMILQWTIARLDMEVKAAQEQKHALVRLLDPQHDARIIAEINEPVCECGELYKYCHCIE
jgi:hypothetical protein